jgi:hypothetical protein
VPDFGGLKAVRAWLHEVFDHTVLVPPTIPTSRNSSDWPGSG